MTEELDTMKLILAELKQQTIQLNRLAREQATTRELTSKFVNSMIDAEAEIPEKTRRFGTWFHDMHDIAYMLEVRGLPIHPWILREMERCDDRARQILEALNDPSKDGRFEKIRREMAADPLNRWDHTRLLDKPKENGQ